MKEWREEKIDKRFILGTCIVLAILYFIPLESNMLTFHFKHANIFHLVVNMIALTTVMYRCKTYMLPLAFLFTSLIWLFATNVIGFSGIIFFMWGTRFPYDIHNSTEPVKYIGMTTIPFLTSFLIPSLSFTLHFFPFLIGGIFGLIDYVNTRFNNIKPKQL